MEDQKEWVKQHILENWNVKAAVDARIAKNDLEITQINTSEYVVYVRVARVKITSERPMTVDW